MKILEMYEAPPYVEFIEQGGAIPPGCDPEICRELRKNYLKKVLYVHFQNIFECVVVVRKTMRRKRFCMFIF